MKTVQDVSKKKRAPDWGTPESTASAKATTPNESYEPLDERSPSERASFAIGKIMHSKQYKSALESLMKMLQRSKSKQTPGASKQSPKHSIAYYAAKIAKGYNDVDGKTLAGMLPKNFVLEDAPASNTGSIPDSTNTGPMNKSRKKSIVTRRYIEILGKRKKIEA